MEHSDHVNWKELLSFVLESARVDGYAIVGFGFRPTDNDLLQLNNQGMTELQFLGLLGNAQRAFLTTLPESTLQKLKDAAEA